MHNKITLTGIMLALTLLLVLVVYPGTPTASAAGEPQIVINGQTITSDAPPMLTNGRTLVPIRVISESLGAEVTWQASTRTVHIRHDGKNMILQIDNVSALVGYQAVTLDAPAVIVNARTMVPLRFVAEAMGAEVIWDAGSRSVLINLGTPPIDKPVPEKPVTETPVPNQPVPDQPVTDQPVTDQPAPKDLRVLQSIEAYGNQDAFEAAINIPKGINTTYTLIQPDRLVVDLKDARMGAVQESIVPPPSNVVGQIRVGVSESGMVRVVFDLLAPADCLVTERQGQLNVRLVKKSSAPASANLAGKTIMIDPGHGGWNSGAIGVSGSKEKDLVLMVSLKLKGALEARGARVLMTRSDDTFLELSERSALANKLKPDVFVSIHGNGHPDPKVVGVETFYFHAASVELAREIQKAIIKHTSQKDLGIKWRGLSVIKNTKCPGVLVELGFMSNAAEERYLWLGSTQDLHVKAMVEGLENYFAGR